MISAMKILILGAKGYMGGHFLSVFPDALQSTVDIADAGAIAGLLDDTKPDIVINAVGKTGTPNVDWCEDHKEETFHSNVLGPLVLSEACRTRGIYWVHLASGCVYSGDHGGKGFSEDDPPNFSGSFYSRTKQWTDAMLREFSDPKEGRGGILILRIRMPFEVGNHPKNLLSKISRFTRVIDVPNSLSYIPDVLSAALTLIEHRKTGIYHLVNSGPISLYRIATLYRDLVDPLHQCTAMTEKEALSLTRVPRSNCVLSTAKLTHEGIVLPICEERIRECLQAFAPVGAR